MKRLSLLVNLTLAVSMVQAQTTPQLVALTGRTPLLVTQTRDCVTKSCRVALPTPLPPVLPYAGGTAYDSVLGEILVSDGFRIIHVDPDTCSTVCGPYQPPITTSSVVTGLAMDEVQKVLWISDSSNTLSKTTGCPATLVSSCKMAMPVGYTVAGLASDDLRGLLFYAAGDWGMTPPRPNLVVVTKTSSPCTPLCTIQVTGCGTNPMNPITGLGFDPITSTLFMTDGRQTLESKFDLQSCTLSEVRCCGGVQPVNEPYVGLEFLPSRATILGRSCLDSICGTCPNAVGQHTAIGDPTLGNPSFALRMDGLPPQSLTVVKAAFLIVGAGPCQSPGIKVLPFCGPLLVPVQPLIPIVIGPLSPVGTVACTAYVSVTLAVPIDRSLAGQVLSSQFVMTCTHQLAVGTAVSNCLSWAIGGS